MTEQVYLEHIENSIREIESIDFSNSWSYEQVIHSILKIEKLPIILFTVPKGIFIFRARINAENEPFETISSISMPEEKYVKNYGRANKPQQTLFYGSENRPTSYLEFANQLAETTPFNEEVSITVGQWEITKDLVFALIFNPVQPRDTEYYRFHGAAFDEFICKTPNELRKGTVRFYQFFGEKYAQQLEDNIKNYLITCAFSNILFSYNQCNGIMYPSVPRGGDAFNVVIKKNAILEGALVIREVRMDKFIAMEQANGKHSFVNNASLDAAGLDIEKDKIEYVDAWKHWI